MTDIGAVVSEEYCAVADDATARTADAAARVRAVMELRMVKTW
jgi:hypothetical protein